MIANIPSALINVPEGQAIHHVAKSRGIPCHSIFLAAAGKATAKKIAADEMLSMANFAKAACKTQNPDIIWQIALVESSFKIRIIHIEGKKVLTGDEAENYLKNNSLKDKFNKNMNIDIGPLQINWRANGSKWKYKPTDYLDGEFSVYFLSNKILKNYVSTCGMNWINCYHSYDKDRGWGYRSKIYDSGVKLRKILKSFL